MFEAIRRSFEGRKSVEEKRESMLHGKDVIFEPKFLHRLFEESLSKNASFEKTALVYRDDGVPKRSTKYIDLNQNANRFAAFILETIKSGAIRANQDDDWIVCVCMKRSDNLVATLLGIWKAGAAYLPIDTGFPQNRIEHIIRETKPALIIYDDFYPNPKYFSSVKAIKFGDLKRESLRMQTGNIPDDETLTKGNESSKAITLYTSGSTGMPKGVRLRHHTFIHRIVWQLNQFPFSETEDHCIFKTDFTFIDHVAELWCPLMSGKAVIVVPKDVTRNPERFVPVLEEFRIERLLGVPILLRGILMYLNMLESNKTKFMLQHLKLWISSGEALTVQLAHEFFDYFDNNRHKLVNFYGCTEVSSDVCFFELKSKEQLLKLDRIPLGSPLPNTKLYVLDKDMKIVSEGEVGEIHCAGVMIADGYIAGRDSGTFIQNPFEPAGAFSRMYKTGDFGLVKGELMYYEGRKDTQIKIRGHRVDITEVERNVSELSYVDKVSVLVYHATQNDQAVVAFISTKKVFEKSVLKTPKEIETDLKKRLADHMIPQVIITELLPCLPNGKVDRQELFKMYEKIAGKNKNDFVLELDFKNVPKEKLVIAKEVFTTIGSALGIELRNKISAESNFFELGGNSMNSLYTVTELHKKGFYIGITDFLRAQNLGAVLDKVSVSKKPRADDMRMITDMVLVREPIDQLDKEACMRLIATSFFHKADMDQFLPNLKQEHYIEILTDLWDFAIKKGLSFMVKTYKGDLVGVALNFDTEDEPKISTNNPLQTIFSFFDLIEKPLVKNRFHATVGEIFHCLMMATAEHLSAKDNIAVMAFMENEIIKLATSKGFKGIFTTNTNPLTQQFGESVFGYQTLSEVHITKYTDRNGNRPFALAPDTQKVMFMYKTLK